MASSFDPTALLAVRPDLRCHHKSTSAEKRLRSRDPLHRGDRHDSRLTPTASSTLKNSAPMRGTYGACDLLRSLCPKSHNGGPMTRVQIDRNKTRGSSMADWASRVSAVMVSHSAGSRFDVTMVVLAR